ncbi:MAG: hypothetical protein QM703_07545 [Gemmatales bacterium]
MTSSCCCSPKAAPPTLARKAAGVAGWILPGAVLLLMPKCPACLAAYIALGTGLSLTVSMAGYVQTGLMVICSIVLTLLTIRVVAKWMRAGSNISSM